MIKIVGGGLSGLATGISLLTRGEKATIYEQFSGVGRSIGRDAMAIRNYDLPYDQIERFNELGLRVKNVKPISRIIKYAPSGKSMEVYSKDKPLFYVILRDSSDKESLDVQLLRQFERAGGKIQFGKKKNIQFGDVIATRLLYTTYWCFGREYVDTEIDQDTIHFFMDHNYAPGGYFALIPWGKNEFSFGVAIGKSNNTKISGAINLPRTLDRFIESNKLVQSFVNGATVLNEAGGTAYSNVPTTAKVGNKLFVGTAAGFLDASRFFGVKYALESGVFAGQSIAEGKDYDSLWKNAFEKELVESFYRKLVLDSMVNDDLEKLILEDKLPVHKYDKFPKSIRDTLRKVEIGKNLQEWRERYRIDKL